MDRRAEQRETAHPEGVAVEAVAITAPSIQLPRGGGAIRGIGEKFAANPVTGTGSMSVPIATSPGRSGFGPLLSLAYDSGAGNGPFGFGWNLSLPSITRKTDRGLPKYRDAEETDEFILSGAEDLAPMRVEGGATGQRETLPPRAAPGKTYHIQRYRPRIEGLFARIERWTSQDEPKDTFWRSISKDNITTWYGKTEESRIADPDDPSRIFSWLICESHDDKGNVIVYQYQAENSAGVDPSQAHERNRTEKTRSANRYLKHIRYGNRTPYYSLLAENQPPTPLPSEWLFEVIFDYGEHDTDNPTANDTGRWSCRTDPFSSYRAGFEVRTYRLCQRVLMFHHFPDEPEVGADCLVRSTDFTYRYEQAPADSHNPSHTFLVSVTQSGYKRRPAAGYLKKSLPPLEFEYSQAIIQEEIREINPESLENLPDGLDDTRYRWVDLDGEGISGILTEQAEGWFYKRNLSPANRRREDGEETIEARFGPLELVAEKPSLAALGRRHQQFLDLAGDGQLDFVELNGPTPGFYERTPDERWKPFTPFTSLPVLNWEDPNVRFVDLTGDGHADVLVTEDQVLTWYPSLEEAGFGPAERVHQALNEEKGPRLVFADGTQSIYLADLSGDGLNDFVRVRNGEICYWPNLGYGRFGAKVTMDNAPWFDHPDLFDQRRIRLADIDGSGNADILYLGGKGVQLYFNQSGNGWSAGRPLSQFPQIDNLSTVTAVDLLGNGAACLVWSSPLPGDRQRSMRYIDLMGGQKPHLLVKSVNNLGAETHVHYAPSTQYYLADKLAGKPWITKIPFPVHVVERVETYDHISRNRFVTRYAYHHGYFDGIEREFRGFGLVEQWDTEEFAALDADGRAPANTNSDASSHVPPVLTRTWFHTGAYFGRGHVSNFFAGIFDTNDVGEYYREPGLSDTQARALLLDDTVLPEGLTPEEEREACRALKGSMRRQEVYALDGTAKAQHPYTVTEQNFTLRCLQPAAGNRHAVFFTQTRESISYHYERNPADPRVQHVLTLEVDEFGNVLKQAALGYGRRQPDLDLSPADQAKQAQILLTYTENRVTNAVDTPDDHRTPLPCESRTFDLTGLTLPPGRTRFTFDEVLEAGATALALDYEKDPTAGRVEKRLIEHVRTDYRRNDLSGSLPLGELQSLALPFESYKLAFTPGLVAKVYGDRVSDAMLANEGRYVHTGGDGNWWIPSGQAFYSPDPTHTPSQERAYARRHFFLLHRYRNPFHTDAVGAESFVTYDVYDLLVQETRDALGNRVTVGERNVDPTQPLVRRAQDYRVLQPALVMDPNRNRSAVAFDALGMVVGAAVMGKPAPAPMEGDSLNGFRADLTQAEIDQFLADPKGPMAATLLAGATTRVVYDLTAWWREPDPAKKPPAVAATLARETHVSDLQAGRQTKIQASLSYSDGFGREIQKKLQAEPGPAPRRDASGKLIVGADGQPVMTPNDVSPRWVGSGWTVFNNKGKPVRQYEPFFTDTHRFEFDVRIGVSPVLFYDPVERVVATLHPNHTWEKGVFDPWRQATWDVNDTVTLDPRSDEAVKGFFLNPDGASRLPETDYLPTWHALRTDPAHETEATQKWPDPKLCQAEQAAANQAAIHAATPTIAHFDPLGRAFLTVAHNRFKRSDTLPADPPNEAFYCTRVLLDIEGNQREVRDAVVQAGDPLGRIVMRYDYDLLGNRIHQASLEAGERWMLNDVAGRPIRAWDSRGHQFRTEYDPLRRPLRQFVRGADATQSDPRTFDRELLFERMEYGEGQANDIALNLRTRVFKHCDAAGVVTNQGRNPITEKLEAYDFKGNLLGSTRELAQDYKNLIDWTTPPPMSATFASRTTYDALNRPTTVTTPDRSVYRPTYNAANLLDKVEVSLRGERDSTGQRRWTTVVTNIDYNAKGQRTRIHYQNGAETTYRYDAQTFRLTTLKTTRPPGSNGLVSSIFTNPATLQDLRYTYDPVGNITRIAETALATVVHAGQTIEPVCRYTYDAVYRLIEATGREHIDQSAFQFAPTHCNYRDYPFAGSAQANDPQAVRNYSERYDYDPVGNIERMLHRVANGGWTRAYEYQETSLIEDGAQGAPRKTSNRLSRTTLQPDGNQPIAEPYTHDAHGNMTTMPHLPLMQWDFKDQLRATSKQATNTCAPETTFYVYDAAGQRVRKVTERQNGACKDERIYLGGFEVFRAYNGAGATVTLERETLHILDDQQRIALVETRTQGIDPTPPQLIRYQFGNHLGSASLELDHQAQIISYEEYYPYGSASYQAVRSQTETPKRYRYTGKERDEESGLYYHGARYYAPWLGRWLACDPAGPLEVDSLYAYAANSPVTLIDSDGLIPTKPNTSSDAAWRQTEQRIANILDEAKNVTREGSQVGGLYYKRFDEVVVSNTNTPVLHTIDVKNIDLNAPSYTTSGGLDEKVIRNKIRQELRSSVRRGEALKKLSDTIEKSKTGDKASIRALERLKQGKGKFAGIIKKIEDQNIGIRIKETVLFDVNKHERTFRRLLKEVLNEREFRGKVGAGILRPDTAVHGGPGLGGSGVKVATAGVAAVTLILGSQVDTPVIVDPEGNIDYAYAPELLDPHFLDAADAQLAYIFGGRVGARPSSLDSNRESPEAVIVPAIGIGGLIGGGLGALAGAALGISAIAGIEHVGKFVAAATGLINLQLDRIRQPISPFRPF